MNGQAAEAYVMDMTKPMEMPKMKPNPYDNVDSVSSMHMFQLEANFIDDTMRSFHDNMEFVLKGIYIPYLRIAWEDIKTLIMHIQPLMAVPKREAFDRLIHQYDKVFMFDIDGKIMTEDGEEVEYLNMYGRVLTLKLDDFYKEFIRERQKVGLGVFASKPQVFASGTIGLKPDQRSAVGVVQDEVH